MEGAPARLLGVGHVLKLDLRRRARGGGSTYVATAVHGALLRTVPATLRGPSG